ncbi:MAG: BamA/TamA family outer membrane protein [Steroidobacteraceae bacterium]
MPAWADSAADSGSGADVPTPDASGVKQSAPAPGMSSWFDPTKLPFIPVPEIAVDPDSGTTLGILPVWLTTNDRHVIRRIVAPDLLYNPYFGYGFHARVYSYNSEDEQWSLVGGAKQRVERELDAEYQRGRLREQRWSYTASLIYDKSGTPRFFGIGNNSPAITETNYTNAQKLAQTQVGLNLGRTWQVLYTMRMRSVDVLPGTLARIASIENRFANILGLGTNSELLNRLSIVYDSRDSLTAPRHGMEWVAYGGVASRSGIFNDSLYSEAGVDGRSYWSVAAGTILAAHMALRYLPSARRLPFWALSSIGGGESEIGGEQPLRGFGSGRFYDRNAFSASVELRHTVWSFDSMATHVDIEVTPFVDLGQVFRRTSTFPIQHLHKVGGVGFRAVARPSVVGYVDIGYGSEGTAVFTGINYPF